MNVNKKEKSTVFKRRVFAAVMAAIMIFGVIAGAILAIIWLFCSLKNRSDFRPVFSFVQAKCRGLNWWQGRERWRGLSTLENLKKTPCPPWLWREKTKNTLFPNGIKFLPRAVEKPKLTKPSVENSLSFSTQFRYFNQKRAEITQFQGKFGSKRRYGIV